MRAEFKRKEVSIDAYECVVDKVVCLSQEAYLRFTKALWLEREFIKDNQDVMRVEDDIWHCLLVTAEGLDEGVLVQSEGSDYARYTSFVPSVSGILQQMDLEKVLTEESERTVETGIQQFM